MFTGLIEEIGTMKHISRQGEAMVLTIEAARILDDVHIGDSISVNGVCLTVVSYDHSSVKMDVMPETFRKTNLKQLQPGGKVNLERAMKADGRFGGHIVQGHVDSTGSITSRYNEHNAVVFTIQVPDAVLLRYVIPHGSITVDGISLTVVNAGSDSLTISIIPHTLSQTTLQHKQAGDTVNLEFDVLGKYVERLLASPNPEGRDDPKRKGTITANFLSENGFI
jgi:riboflavin synthase